MDMNQIRQSARAGLPFNPFSSDALIGANLTRLQSARQAFGWQDLRFVSRDDAVRLGWQIDAKARSVQITRRNRSNGTLETEDLFNGQYVIGLPPMETMLGLSDDELAQLQAQGPAELTIGPAGRQVEQAAAAAGKQEPAQGAGATPTPAAGATPDVAEASGRYVVAAPYWLDGLHNYPGLAMAKELNEVIRKAGISRDPQAMARLMEGRDRAAMYELKVITEEEQQRDLDFLANPAEPATLLDGALVRDKEGAYRPKGGGLGVLVDRGESLTVQSKSAEAYKAAIELAKAKGWTAIELSGKGKMLSDAWLEAKISGVEVVNYKPTLEDEKRLAERLAAENEKKGPETPAPKEERTPEVVEVRPYVDAEGHQKTATITYTVTQEGVPDQKFDNPKDAAKAFAEALAKNLPAVVRSVVRAEGQVETDVMVAGTSKTKGRNSKLVKSADAAVDREFHSALETFKDVGHEKSELAKADARAAEKAQAPAQGSLGLPEPPAASAGKVFSGRILRIEGDEVVQKVGRGADEIQRHPVSKLNRVPSIDDVVDIKYDAAGVGEVSGPGPSLER